MQRRTRDSGAGWWWGAKHVWGMEPVGEMGPAANLVPDIAANSEMLLFWGCDPETTPWGFNGQMASQVCYWFTRLGIKCIYICPDLNYGAAVHADKWIPIRPNSDAALQLAVAYTWLSEGTWDKEYVVTHSVGFDKFKAYVLGEEDGILKTPAWAADKTGIPEHVIKTLAREWASKKTSVVHGNGGPGMRSAYSTEQGRLEVLLLAMQGLGKPGVHQLKMLEWGVSAMWVAGRSPMPLSKFMPQRIMPAYSIIDIGGERAEASAKNGAGLSDLDKLRTPAPINPTQFIPKDLIHEAILNAPVSWYGNSTFPGTVEDQFVKYTYPAKGCSEVHMIWTDTPCWITCWNNSNTYIKALRSPKIECIVAQHPWLENDCQFADIILPVSTKMEELDITSDMESGQYSTVLYGDKCIEPLGESKSDYEAVALVAEKLGLLEKYTGGKSVEEWVKLNYQSSGIPESVSYDEFKDKGYYVIPTDPGWKKIPVGLSEFVENPAKHPLKTPSGKIEFCSQNLTKYFPDDKERPPVPHWIEKGESHDERISSDRAKQYPLQIITNHGRWRVHAQCDDITWTREIQTCKVQGPDGYKYEPLWINPQDAETRGINNGDIVSIYNERGVVLGGAYVTQRIMHGARYDPIIAGEVDRGGAINTITPRKLTSRNATGMVVSSFLVEVAQVTPDQMDAWRREYPHCFNKDYDPASGLTLRSKLSS